MNQTAANQALVVTPDVHDALHALLRRCQQSQALLVALGEDGCTHAPAGIRALFAGPSGTGKARAANWLAKGMGVPLCRVDLAAVVSRYGGETEKNLARLFAEAEHAHAVLLFNEADALFAAPAGAGHAEDRFADRLNGYLLQRLESFGGVILLTSRARSGFDATVMRRLDVIIEFTLPDPSRGLPLGQT